MPGGEADPASGRVPGGPRNAAGALCRLAVCRQCSAACQSAARSSVPSFPGRPGWRPWPPGPRHHQVNAVCRNGGGRHGPSRPLRRTGCGAAAQLLGASVAGVRWPRSSSSLSSVAVAPATASTARSNVSALRAAGLRNPLTFLTYCSAAARTSSSVTLGVNGSRRVLMLRHISWTVRRATARRPGRGRRTGRHAASPAELHSPIGAEHGRLMPASAAGHD